MVLVGLYITLPVFLKQTGLKTEWTGGSGTTDETQPVLTFFVEPGDGGWQDRVQLAVCCVPIPTRVQIDTPLFKSQNVFINMLKKSRIFLKNIRLI